MTPNQKCSGDIRLLSSDFRLSESLSIAPGYIHLICLIRSDHILDIFGEKYFMPDDVEYEYVWVTIDTTQEKL